jgi:hypothetical protein
MGPFRYHSDCYYPHTFPAFIPELFISHLPPILGRFSSPTDILMHYALLDSQVLPWIN